MTIVAGIDEVGRGSLSGPVIAAAVILRGRIFNLKDSKKLSATKRRRLYDSIASNCYFSIGSASVAEIDQLNILNATLLAMQRALIKLPISPDKVIIDGNDIFSYSKCEMTSMIKGDEKIPEIGAASIIAKVTRDQLMMDLHEVSPEYLWANNKGYGSKAHIEAILKYGASKHHRLSFAPMNRLPSDMHIAAFHSA